MIMPKHLPSTSFLNIKTQLRPYTPKLCFVVGERGQEGQRGQATFRPHSTSFAWSKFIIRQNNIAYQFYVPLPSQFYKMITSECPSSYPLTPHYICSILCARIAPIQRLSDCFISFYPPASFVAHNWYSRLSIEITVCADSPNTCIHFQKTRLAKYMYTLPKNKTRQIHVYTSKKNMTRQIHVYTSKKT